MHRQQWLIVAFAAIYTIAAYQLMIQKTQGTDSYIVIIHVHAYNPLLNGNIVAEALAKLEFTQINPFPKILEF